MHQNTNNTLTLNSANKKKMKSYKGSQKWSHQKELESLVNKRVSVVLQIGQVLSGTVLNVDQFTVRLSLETEDKGNHIATIFKSAITYYFEQESAQ